MIVCIVGSLYFLHDLSSWIHKYKLQREKKKVSLRITKLTAWELERSNFHTYDYEYTSRPRFSVAFFRSMRNAMPLVSIAGTAEEKNKIYITWP
jgi:hypothetical protein